MDSLEVSALGAMRCQMFPILGQLRTSGLLRRALAAAVKLGRVDSSASTARTTFESVALPAGQRGSYDAAAIDAALRRWVISAPLRAMAEASGWPWPGGSGDTLALLDSLAERSADWDFRNTRERNYIEGAPAQVNGRVIPNDLVLAAARALGLVDATPVARRTFSHVVVLSGLARACVNRTHFTAELLRNGIKAGSVAVLGAHRKLGGAEPEQARGLGFGELNDEADVIVAATRQAFGLGEAASAQESEPAFDPDQPEQFHAAWARYRWDSVEVLIVPSSEPAVRRADTVEQLSHWAGLAGVGGGDDVLVVTTQIYVPFQYMEALRVLGFERGCGVYSCGVDAATSLLPGKLFGGRDYLQEIRSALRSAPMLLRAARAAAG